MKYIENLKLSRIMICYFLFYCPISFGQPISGIVKPDAKGKLYLYEKNKLIDSTFISDGKFSFIKHYNTPSKLRIIKTGNIGYFDFIYAEPKVCIEINGDSIWRSKVINSRENNCFRQIKNAGSEFVAQLNNSADSVFIYSRLKDSISMNRCNKLNEQAWAKISEAWYCAIGETINTFAALYCFQSSFNDYSPRPFSRDTMYNLYRRFPLNLKSSETGQIIANYFVADSLLKKGMQIIDFAAQTPDGLPLSVSSFRGKYLLIDFWASWCGPCHKEGEKILLIYQKYQSKGFDVLGFSLDTDKRKWIHALKEDNFPWHQISDLQGPDSEVVNIYSVKSIPFAILVDPNGQIIASNVRADNLELELIKIFNE